MDSSPNSSDACQGTQPTIATRYKTLVVFAAIFIDIIHHEHYDFRLWCEI